MGLRLVAVRGKVEALEAGVARGHTCWGCFQAKVDLHAHGCVEDGRAAGNKTKEVGQVPNKVLRAKDTFKKLKVVLQSQEIKSRLVIGMNTAASGRGGGPATETLISTQASVRRAKKKLFLGEHGVEKGNKRLRGQALDAAHQPTSLLKGEVDKGSLNRH